MGKVKLNHAPPTVMEARYIEETRQLTYQQRFEKLMAIIELSCLLKSAKKAANRLKGQLDIEELEKLNNKNIY